MHALSKQTVGTSAGVVYVYRNTFSSVAAVRSDAGDESRKPVAAATTLHWPVTKELGRRGGYATQ